MTLDELRAALQVMPSSADVQLCQEAHTVVSASMPRITYHRWHVVVLFSEGGGMGEGIDGPGVEASGPSSTTTVGRRTAS